MRGEMSGQKCFSYLPEGGKDLMIKKKENSFEKIYEIVRQRR